MNLIVQDGLSIIESCVENVRESVVYWIASPKRRQKFAEVVKQLYILHSKELVLDCKTRWNSTCLMLSTALLYKDVFAKLSQRDSNYRSLPSESEWEMAQEICSKLELFCDVSDVFSGSTYPTANIFFPNICEVKISLHEWALSPNDIIAEMARKMLVKFDSYWDVIHGILGVAAILDPRYKMKLVEWSLRKIYGDLAGYHITRITDILYSLLNAYHQRPESQVGSSSQANLVSHSDRQVARRGRFLSDFDTYASTDQEVHNVRAQLDTYLRHGLIPRTEEFDILAWWKSHVVKYPILRLIARDILGIPVTTVVSESAFSTCGRLLSPHRSRLEENTIEALMCSQNWLINQIKGVSTNAGSSASELMGSIVDDENDPEEEVHRQHA
ncbi:Zinc finger BED domain-containing protein RICESLEEPER 2 [Linum perenne]